MLSEQPRQEDPWGYVGLQKAQRGVHDDEQAVTIIGTVGKRRHVALLTRHERDGNGSKSSKLGYV